MKHKIYLFVALLLVPFIQILTVQPATAAEGVIQSYQYHVRVNSDGWLIDLFLPDDFETSQRGYAYLVGPAETNEARSESPFKSVVLIQFYHEGFVWSGGQLVNMFTGAGYTGGGPVSSRDMACRSREYRADFDEPTVSDSSTGTVRKAPNVNPNKYYTFELKLIGEDAFKGITELEEIELPSAVTTIWGGAFDGCTNLKKITLPPSIVGIGADAFVGCDALEEVHISDLAAYCNIDYLFGWISGWRKTTVPTWNGAKLFLNDVEVTNLTIPNSVTAISYGAFCGCNISSVIIPNSVTSIGDGAFENCSNLKSINIPNSIMTIGEYAFSGCSGLTSSINIPNGVEVIEKGTFCGCSGLTSIIIPNSVMSIGEYAFSGCSGLTSSINIPNSVISIGDGAFEDCSNLKSITIPSSVRSIGEYAFSNCSSLTSPINIPNGVETIEECTFGWCSGLTSITIPSSVTSIKWGAFRDCSALTSVTIPSSIKTIDDYVFCNCSGLTSVTIPSSVTRIGEKAFNGCSSVKDYYFERMTPPSTGEDVFWPSVSDATLHIPYGSRAKYRSSYPWLEFRYVVQEGTPENIFNFADANLLDECIKRWDANGDGNFSKDEAANVKEIGTMFKEQKFGSESSDLLRYFTSLSSIPDYAFSNCSGLTTITITKSVTSIGDYAFNGCNDVTSIRVESGNTVYDSRGNCNAIVETSTNNLLRGCQNSIVPNTVTSLGKNAFTGCTGLTSVIIPNSVTSLSEYTFSRCTGLTSIKVESGNTVYDSRDNCNAIIETSNSCLIKGCKNTIIPNTVKYIGYSAFKECSGLVSIIIPNSVTSIGQYAFRECSDLKYLTIGSSVLRIDRSAFDYCSNLETIKVDNGNTTYDSRSNCNAIINTKTNTLFLGCKNTIIPNSVATIDVGAFEGCIGLSFITIPNSVTSIGSWAFSGCSSLRSITIPNSVTSIEYAAFSRCTALTTATIGNSVKSIEIQSFLNCRSLASVTIGSSVTSIGDGAFAGCSALSEVRSLIKQPFTINDDVFRYYDNSYKYPATLYVPRGTKAKYQSTDGWKNFTNIIETDFKDDPKGDVNGDQTVDVADIATVIDVMAKDNNDPSADVNGDGAVDVADIATIIDEMAARARMQKEAEE